MIGATTFVWTLKEVVQNWILRLIEVGIVMATVAGVYSIRSIVSTRLYGFTDESDTVTV